VTTNDTIVDPRFVSWVRTGLASHHATVATGGVAPDDVGHIDVDVRLRSTGDGVERVDTITSPAIHLLGPGDVVGLDESLIVRRYPEPGATDAEPNYFPLVELSAVDLPWRFTPAGADGERLQPWLVLVVVEDRPGVTIDTNRPRLSVLTVDVATELPDLAQSWAWAHVHAEDDLTDGVVEALGSRPQALRARLMCPRRLRANRSWVAALVPSFEAGRRAGLGEVVLDGLGSAWQQGATDVRLPVYSWWRFTTGPRGDFESLVRRLQPRELGPSVGRRDLDISDPGGGLPRAAGLTATFAGALTSPVEPTGPEDPRLDRTSAQLQHILTRTAVREESPDDYDAARDDPVVGPTRYAAHQAHRPGLDGGARHPRWYTDLNLDVRHRAAAGLGTEVVRRDQEALMAVAWQAAADLHAVNDLLTRSRAAWEVARSTIAGIAALSDESLVQIAVPAAARLRRPGGGTVRQTAFDAGVPDGLLSSAFRRLCSTTPGLKSVDAQGRRVTPSRAVTTECLADPAEFSVWWIAPEVREGTDVQSEDDPSATLVRNVQTDILALARIDSFVPASGTVDQTPGQGPVEHGPMEHRPIEHGPLDSEAPVPRRRAGRGLQPQEGGRQRPGGGGRVRSRQVPVDGDVIDGGTIDIPTGMPRATTTADLVAEVRAALDPHTAITARLDHLIVTPSGEPSRTPPAPAFVRPRITTPMYERLAAISPELVVPGIGDVPSDTLGLLEVNDAFVESFMAGLNTELGREFLWRELPTRLDSTWAQRFWNPRDPDVLDIAPIRTWDRGPLGTHPDRSAQGVSLVLLVTGALLRRYPDTRIYAVEAMWEEDDEAGIWVRRERIGGDVQLPAMSGDLGPGVRFYGFTLTAPTALGSTDVQRHPGYFFVLEEQPRDARFGLDAPSAQRQRGKAPPSWDRLSWAHLGNPDGTPLPDFVDVLGPVWMLEAGEREGTGDAVAWGEDAAAMAIVTTQQPVRMLVHADSMLPAPGFPVELPDIELPDVLEPGPGGPSDPS
jgi:hypothetical protein